MAGSRIKGITIEIDGNVTPLQKALQGVNKDLRTTQSDLRDVNKLLKLDPGNVELLKQKQELLKKAIEDTKSKLDTEKQALQQLKQADQSPEVKQQMEALERQIVEDEQALKSLEEESKSFGSVAKQQFQAAGDKLKEVGGKITDVGKDMSMKVTAPIAGVATAAVKVAADFEAQMSKVKAISGATGLEFDDLQAKAREMGAKTKFSATEAGEAFEYMAMAGWKSGDMMEGIEGIMNLAAASGEELGTTSDIVTDALTAFGLSAKDSAHFADILAAASTNANTNVSMLGESFKYVAPVAGSLGFSAEDVSVALGLMANSGIKASQAGTSLKNLLTNMSNPTDTMASAMDALGVSLDDGQGNMKSFNEIMQDLRKGFGELKMPAEDVQDQLERLGDAWASGEMTETQYNNAVEDLIQKAYGAEGALKAQAAAQLAGKTGMAGLLAIVNAAPEDYDKLTEAINNCDGTAQTMSDTMQDNLEGQLTILKSQLQELAISLSETIMPIVKEVIAYIQGVVDKLNNLDAGTKDMIVKIAMVAAAIGPVLVIIGTLISSIGAISGAIGTVVGVMGGPLALAIGVLIVSITYLIAHWEDLKQIVLMVKDAIVKAWNTVKTKTVEAWNNMKTNVTEAVNNIKNKVTGAWENMKTAASEKWNSIKDTVTTKVGDIYTAATEKFKDMKDKIVGIVDSAKDKIGGIVETIKDIFSFDWELPDLKLPHIYVGSYIDVPVLGTIPDPFSISVEWYKKAYNNPYLFTSPTVIGGRGFGDGGGSGEIVYGRDQLLRDIAQASGGETTINIYPTPGMNVNQLADEVQRRLALVQRQKERAYA